MKITFDIFYSFLFFIAKYTNIISNIIILFTHNIKSKNLDLEFKNKQKIWNGTQRDNMKTSIGEYNLKFQKNGYFMIFYNNGNIWKGSFENDLENGEFTCELKNGNIINGKFVNGKREGDWNIIKKNGDILYYSYNNNNKNPIITIKYKNGNTFEGVYKNDKKNGLGIMRYKNGNIFIGNYENGNRFGNGYIKFKDGDIMYCLYKNNKLDGECVLYYKNGNIFNAKYNNDEINNPCELIYQNGNKFIGNFNNDLKKNGFGIYYDKKSNKSFLQKYNSDNNNIKSEFWFHGDHTNFVLNQDIKIKNKISCDDYETIYCPLKMDIMYEPVILNCNHKFCLYFLDSWKKYSNVQNFCCPLCKRKITSYSINTKAENILEKCKFENNKNKISLRDIRRYYDFQNLN
jgi:hypothetical protein